MALPPYVLLVLLLLGAISGAGAQAGSGSGSPMIRAGMTIALKGGRYNKYCADEKWRVRCNRDSLNPWEKFEVQDFGGKLALVGGMAKKYCVSTRWGMRCNRISPGDDGLFNIVQLENNQVRGTSGACLDRS